LKERLESSPFLVAILEESIVGFANFSNGKNDEAKLLAIYVLLETQGERYWFCATTARHPYALRNQVTYRLYREGKYKWHELLSSKRLCENSRV